MKKPGFLFGLACSGFLLAPSLSKAATIVEYFNNYGTSNANLSTKGSAGGGWAGSWAGNTGPGYVAGQTLSYSSAGYSNAGNESGSDDGVSGWGGTGGGNDISSRAFSTALTGTVWISALARYAVNDAETKFWLDLSNTTAPRYVGLVARQATINTGSGDVSATTTYATNTSHLMLIRIVLDASGSNDTIEYWVDPNLSGGTGGLGTPSQSASGSDFFGTALNGIGVSFRRDQSAIDSIRISNDADGFAQVTGMSAIPEPSASLLSALGILFLARRRR